METNTSSGFEVGVYDDTEKYEALTDEELIVEIKDKMDNAALEYLIQRYRSFVRAKGGLTF